MTLSATTVFTVFAGGEQPAAPLASTVTSRHR
jgi:hypothetical protein